MGALKNKHEETEENILSVLLFRFLPYWPLFIFLMVLMGIGATLYLRYATPMYSANATILIKDQKKGVDDSKMVESLDMYNSNKIVENEIVVLSSKGLMQQVVKNLHLYAPIYEKGQVRDNNAYVSSPVVIEAENPDALTTTRDVMLTYDSVNSKVVVDGRRYPMNRFVPTAYGNLKFSKNKKAYRTPTGPLYFSLFKPESIAGGFASRVQISATNKISTVLQINYQDESPDRAKDVLNQLLWVYTENTVKEKDALAANTLSFIESRLKLVVQDLDSIERTIQKYKSQQGIVDLSEQGREFLHSVSENDRQTSNINVQLAVLDQVERYVVSKNNKGGIVPSTLGINDQILTSLLQKLSDAESEHDKLRQTMAENSPAVIAVTNEIERLRPAILENVRSQRNNMLASRRNLAQTNGMYTSMLRTIPAKERELLEISRQQSIKNNVYSFLLQKREETALSSSSSLADSKVIDLATASYSPVSPKPLIAYLAALVFAFGLGIAIVIAKELLTGKILFRQDIERYTQIPIVAEIVSLKDKGGVVVNQPDKIYISEQFRHLRAAMGLYGRVVTRKKILITSSIPGEGKSFVAANLAMSLALSGKKVVLVDADIRGPKTSSTFNLYYKSGLANYLQNEVELEQIINTSDNPNLFIIPAGQSEGNPTELLLNGQLPELFGKLERLFDYVIVDTSPVDPVTDAYVLSEFCDRTLFIVRHGHTPKTMIQMLDENNKIKALKNLAIVFNGVKKRGFIKGSYGYGYGFGYEYVYKSSEGKQKDTAKTFLN